MDAITLLRNDHKTVEELFKRFEKAGDKSNGSKREIVDKIIEELSIHAAIEEQIFYPVARGAVPDTEDMTLESLEEHHIVKWVLSELDGLDPTSERFEAKVTVLIENVRHHIKEEQEELFPKVKAGLSRAALNELGDALAEAKATAPTRPHPRSPDTPPANTLTGAVSGVVDRIVSAAATAVDGARKTARTATAGAKSTGRAALSGGKSTATTAKKGARATKATAKSTGKRAASTSPRTAKRATGAAKATKRGAAKKATATKRSR
jgi:hemerythrin superfamily protein